MPQPPDPEPRWPALVAMFSVGLLFLALPQPLTLGPSWLVLCLLALLLTPWLITHRIGHRRANRILGFSLSALLTLALVWAIVSLVMNVSRHPAGGRLLLRSAAALWVSNVLVFAIWYWRLDGGGPHARDDRHSHTEGAFLFPQMTMLQAQSRWKPGFIDYLFLAFNTSSAFSPADVPALSRWAKLLMMAQSIASLTILVVLGARAVNLL